jgi:hypothetical protein
VGAILRSPNSNRKLILAHPRSGSSYVTNLIHRYYDSVYGEWGNWQSETFRIHGVATWLRLLAEPVYAFKYFSFWRHQFDFDQLRAVILEHDITVYALYRSNMVDTIVSQIVADRIGYLDAPPEQFPTQWELTNQVEVIGSYYNWFDKMCDALDDLIHRTVTYESLSGDGIRDLRLFDIETDHVEQYHQKVVSDSLKQTIIAQTGLNFTKKYERSA